MALPWLRPGMQGGKALPVAVISYFPPSANIAMGYNYFKHHFPAI